MVLPALRLARNSVQEVPGAREVHMEVVADLFSLLFWAANTDVGACLILVLVFMWAVRFFAATYRRRVESSSMRRHDDMWK